LQFENFKLQSRERFTYLNGHNSLIGALDLETEEKKNRVAKAVWSIAKLEGRWALPSGAASVPLLLFKDFT